MVKMSKEPTIKFQSKISSLKLSGWENDKGFSWVIGKRYKDKETGEWTESKYLSNWDLEALISLAAQAKEFLSERKLAAKVETGQAPWNLPDSPAKPTATFGDDDIPF
jgi:hypothetical protein